METPGGGIPPTPQSQITPPAVPLIDKVETLRSHFGIAKELPMAAVVENAAERLGLALESGSLMARADECIAALSKMPPASTG